MPDRRASRSEDAVPARSVWPTGSVDRVAQLAAGGYLPATASDTSGIPPAVAAHAVRAYTEPGDMVLDPDCGAGTVLVEALRAGRHAVGMTGGRGWPVARANLTAAKLAGALSDGMVLQRPGRRSGYPARRPGGGHRGRTGRIGRSGRSALDVRSSRPRTGPDRKPAWGRRESRQSGPGPEAGSAPGGGSAGRGPGPVPAAAAPRRPRDPRRPARPRIRRTGRDHRYRRPGRADPGRAMPRPDHAATPAAPNTAATRRPRPRTPGSGDPASGRLRLPGPTRRRRAGPGGAARPHADAGGRRRVARARPGTGWSGRGARKVGRMTPVRREPAAQPARRPYYRDGEVTLHTGDAADVLATLPTGSVDCVVTSPPYWGLRDYGTRGWAGGRPGCRHTQTVHGQPRPAAASRPRGRAGGAARCPRDRQYGHEPTLEGATSATLRRGLRRTGPRPRPDRHRLAQPRRLLQRHQARRRHRRPDAQKHAGGPCRRRALAGIRARGRGVDRSRALPGPRTCSAFPGGWRSPCGKTGGSSATRGVAQAERSTQPSRRPAGDPVRTAVPAGPPSPVLLRPGPGPEPPARPEAPGRHGPTRRGRRHPPPRLQDARRRKYADNTAFGGDPPGEAMRPTGRQHTAAHPQGATPATLVDQYPAAARGALRRLPGRPAAARDRRRLPPGGVVLDPFSGAGTTGLAARQLGVPTSAST